jgi:hypothetical protein
MQVHKATPFVNKSTATNNPQLSAKAMESYIKTESMIARSVSNLASSFGITSRFTSLPGALLAEKKQQHHTALGASHQSDATNL